MDCTHCQQCPPLHHMEEQTVSPGSVAHGTMLSAGSFDCPRIGWDHTAELQVVLYAALAQHLHEQALTK